MSGSVLVLGAAGFIGRHLAEAIARTGVPVIAGTRSPASFSHPHISNAVAPFDEPNNFRSLLLECGWIIHAASTSTPGSSAAQPQLDGNLRTTLSMVEALQDFPDRRLLYLSSGGTLYGDCLQLANENDPLRPRSYHGAGKAAAEQFIHAWAAQYGGTATILRPSNVYGPGQFPRRGFGIVPAALDCAARGTPLTIWGDGSTVRDYLFISDLISLCRVAMEQDLPRASYVFNAAMGAGTSLNDLLDLVDRTTGIPLQRQHRPARPVDVGRIVPDNSAACTAFNWKPMIGLEDGLKRTWRWFRNQS